VVTTPLSLKVTLTSADSSAACLFFSHGLISASLRPKCLVCLVGLVGLVVGSSVDGSSVVGISVGSSVDGSSVVGIFVGSSVDGSSVVGLSVQGTTSCGKQAVSL